MKAPRPAKFLDEIEPYKPSFGASLDNLEKRNWIKLDWNECQVTPHPEVIKAVKIAADNLLSFYPDVTAKRLREAISEYTGFGIESIRVFNGSDNALRTIFEAYLNPKDHVGVMEATYTQINQFIASRGALLKTGYQNYGDVTYICNPNNPTGNYFSLGEIKTIISTLPDILLIVDEAYFEFSGLTVAGLINEFSNILVVRTFSKAFGLAGLRLGYVLGRPETLEPLGRVSNGKDVNILAQIAGTVALKNRVYMEKYTDVVRSGREWAVDELAKMGLEVINTSCNFFLLRSSKPALLAERLRTYKILVRVLPAVGDCVRVSVGTTEQMHYFVEAVKQILSEENEKWTGILNTGEYDTQALIESACDRFVAQYEGRKPFSDPEVGILHRIITPGDVCIDVGAHFGLYSVALAQLTGPKGVVVAFEPYEPNHTVLRGVLDRLLPGFDRIKAVKFALSDISGFQGMTEPPHEHTWYDEFGTHLGYARLKDNVDWPETQRVEVRTFDGLFEPQFDIDFVKIDVEGAELRVLRGMSDALKRFEPILLVEIEARHLEMHGATSDEVVDFLFGLGYRPFVQRGQGIYPVKGVSLEYNNYFFFTAARMKELGEIR